MKKIIKPPWNLHGKAFIFIYKFPKIFIDSNMKSKSNSKFKGGFGAVMIVRYFESNVGNYDELLWIPGIFCIQKNCGYSIQKIYVSSEDSAVSGRYNWAIPKELANFYFENHQNQEIIKVGTPNEIFFTTKLKYVSMSGIHIKNKFILPSQLLQVRNNKIFLTNFLFSGKIYFSQILEIESNPKFFPFTGKPIMSFYINPMNLYFPNPQIKPL